MNRVFIDTAPLIYLTERTDDLNDEVFSQIQNWLESDSLLVTSTVTLMEILIAPKKNKDLSLENKYRLLIKELFSEPLLVFDEDTAVLSAEFRVRYNLKTPDAIQVAAAVKNACDVFYTNDKELQRIKEMTVICVT
ncbi:MAG: type II toxin-antitoxin system VapC family toxin [Planctomycetota bacterium]|jgi:predicted nucleic acid-binding protein